VVVLPGLMGSELVDITTRKTLWGLADLGWYVSAWMFGGALDDLTVTDAERGGDARRVRATRLLRIPAFTPLLRGVEPYTELIAGAAAGRGAPGRGGRVPTGADTVAATSWLTSCPGC
jgi:hypothetical protein